MLKSSGYFFFFFKIPSVDPKLIAKFIFFFNEPVFRGLFFKPRKFRFKKFLKNFISIARLFSKSRLTIPTTLSLRNRGGVYEDNLVKIRKRFFFKKNKPFTHKSTLLCSAFLTQPKFLNKKLRRYLRFNSVLGRDTTMGFPTETAFCGNHDKTYRWNNLLPHLKTHLRPYQKTHTSLGIYNKTNTPYFMGKKNRKQQQIGIKQYKNRLRNKKNRNTYFLHTKRIFLNQRNSNLFLEKIFYNHRCKQTFNWLHTV